MEYTTDALLDGGGVVVSSTFRSLDELTRSKTTLPTVLWELTSGRSVGRVGVGREREKLQNYFFPPAALSNLQTLLWPFCDAIYRGVTPSLRARLTEAP
jgi:hypothetical protein